MALDRYIAEEVGFDFDEGLITRREAFHRLALLGFGASAAGSLLAACAGKGSTAHKTAGSSAPSSPSTTAAAGNVTFNGSNGQLQGAWAEAARPKGGVLIIHENRGLTDHIRTIPTRFAADGYSGLAIDLLSEEGGTKTVGGDAEAMAALAKVPDDRIIADLKAAVDELVRRIGNLKPAVVGFCFGGGLVWRLLAAGEPRLAAAAPFYGPAPENPDFSGSKAAVLAIYGELDQRVNSTRDRVVTALESAHLPHDVKVFPGANHAFFNDTGPNYNPAAARQAYQDVLGWFGKYLA